MPAALVQRRFMVIWPFVYVPEHEFEPPYVPVIVIVDRLTCAVPVALDEHPDDIMLLVGMSIVNVMSSPDIVPRKDPGIRPCIPEPEKLIEPVTVDPFSVSCQVIVPMSTCPIMLPAPIELLESDPMPAHVPAMDAGDVGPDGDIDALPPHAAANPVNRTIANTLFTLPTIVCRNHENCLFASRSRSLTDTRRCEPSRVPCDRGCGSGTASGRGCRR